MIESIIRWFRKFYNKLVHSIAFLPAFMAAGFLLLALLALDLDAKGLGQQLNQKFRWLTLNDADTARTIVSTAANGLVAVTVFSFSMVMIVMNQAASNLSNRMLNNLIGNPVQKTILGFYIGTLVYALFILSNISSTDKDRGIPSLSIYLLVILVIADIFLFVYFLHYVTQSIIYEQLIQRVHDRTRRTMSKALANRRATGSTGASPSEGIIITAPVSGYFQRFNASRLLKLTKESDIVIRFLHPTGSYLLKGTPLLQLAGNKDTDEALMEKLFTNVDFYYGQEVDQNAYYGYMHLMEVGVKALSPGINDPGTAVLTLHALTDLLAYEMQHALPAGIKDDSGQVRIITCSRSFEELFESSVLAIWDYGQRDRLVQRAVLRLLDQLRYVDQEGHYAHIFDKLEKDVKAQQER